MFANQVRRTVFQTIVHKLSSANISYTILEHEPVYTLEQARKACGNLPEQNVKVLFAKAYKSKENFDYFLIVWAGNKQVDFQQIAASLGVKKVRLASPEEVQTELGIEIGALSPFGYESRYPIVFDRSLLEQRDLFINPGVHDKTIKLESKDLFALVEQSASSFCLV